MNRRVLILALIAIVVLAGTAAGVWAWLSRGGPRPMLEVISDEAPIKVGEETVATAKRGARLPIHARRIGWYQVRADGKLGWIQAEHIRRVQPPDAKPRVVEVEMLAMGFPKGVLDEYPRWGEIWAVVEVQALAAKANAEGGTAIDSNRFMLARGAQRFFHPRVWKTIPVGDHTVDRLERREQFTLPVGQARKLRLAWAIPADLAVAKGWHVVYVPVKPKGSAKTPSTPAKAD